MRGAGAGRTLPCRGACRLGPARGRGGAVVRRILVTGSADGLGRAAARALLSGEGGASQGRGRSTSRAPVSVS